MRPQKNILGCSTHARVHSDEITLHCCLTENLTFSDSLLEPATPTNASIAEKLVGKKFACCFSQSLFCDVFKPTNTYLSTGHQYASWLQALRPVTVRDPSQDDDIAISPPTPAAVQPSQPSGEERFAPDPDDIQVNSQQWMVSGSQGLSAFWEGHFFGELWAAGGGGGGGTLKGLYMVESYQRISKKESRLHGERGGHLTGQQGVLSPRP